MCPVCRGRHQDKISFGKDHTGAEGVLCYSENFPVFFIPKAYFEDIPLTKMEDWVDVFLHTGGGRFDRGVALENPPSSGAGPSDPRPDPSPNPVVPKRRQSYFTPPADFKGFTTTQKEVQAPRKKMDFVDYVSIDDVECIHESEKAIRVDIDGRLEWIPKSQVDDRSEVWKKGQTGTLFISGWIADQKKLR